MADSKCRATLLAALLLARCAEAAIEAHRVTSLPGYARALPSAWYSGFLDVAWDLGTAHLHYVYVEASDVDPASAPVAIWLNGGPGCSSMEGLWAELGPFAVESSSPPRLTPNEYSWNRFAGVLYLESPAGVGLSFPDPTEGVSDGAVARLNANFVRAFLAAFPELQARDFGELARARISPRIAFPPSSSTSSSAGARLRRLG